MLAALPYLSIPAFVLALFGLIAIVSGLWVYFKGSTGNALLEQQDKALVAQQIRLDEQDHKIDEQNRKIDTLVKQNEDQADQIRRLTEMVTQSAKVDALITAVEHGFAKLGADIKVLPPTI